MYRWNKTHINQLINYLKSLENNQSYVYEDLLILEDIKHDIKNSNKYSEKEEIKENMFDEDEDYEELKNYNSILKNITNKYFEEKMLDLFKYKKITYKDILLFTRDNIKFINKSWFNKIEPFMNNDYLSNYLDFRKKTLNRAIYLEYLNKFYIALEKNNNISDFIEPTHEFLHVYSLLLNSNFINSIDSEFLSILGELITSYEMKNKLMFKEEVMKMDIETYTMVISYIKAMVYKKSAINEGINYDEKFKYFVKELNLNKKDIRDMYLCPLEYNYNFVISYFIALELFDIYLKDKEKCFYICNKLILSNKELKAKLKENNITLLSHDNKYIRKLKKEYTILCNR